MTNLDELVGFEDEADRTMEGLSVFSFPIRSILTWIYLQIDTLHFGGRLDVAVKRRPEAGNTLASRLSYLSPFLMTCPAYPMGTSAEDALSVFDSLERIAEMLFVTSYLHLCELMPEVHRNYYSVEKKGDVFELRHKSTAFSQAEVRDIVLAELARGIALRPETDEALFDSMLKSPDLGKMIFTMHAYREHFLKNVFELEIISSNGLLEATTCTTAEFLSFRVSWMAVAQYCLGMAEAVARAHKSGAIDAAKSKREMLEWTVPLLKKTFLLGTIQALSDLSAKKIDSLIELFSIDATTKDASHSGDGYFPALFVFEDSMLFSPVLLQATISVRNALYALNKRDQEKFSAITSQYLEPQLLETATKLFARMKDIVIVEGHHWENGEFDILVFSEVENTVLHVQAKAAVPPEGARRVRSVEARVNEGIGQLERFRSLQPEKRDEVISKAIKRKVSNVSVIDVLLVWSSFGTENVWSKMDAIVPVNVPLLDLITTRKPALLLKDFPEAVIGLLNELCSEVSPTWTSGLLEFGTKSLDLPILELDLASINSLKIELSTFQHV